MPEEGAKLTYTQAEVAALIAAHAADLFPHNKTVHKLATESVTNNTMQNDDELVLPVVANEVALFFIWLIVTAPATPDFKYQFTVPTGATMKGGSNDTIRGSVTFLTGVLDLTTSTALVTAGVTAVPLWVWALYVGGANAGNVQLQWAQNTTNASATQVLLNSFMTKIRLA